VQVEIAVVAPIPRFAVLVVLADTADSPTTIVSTLRTLLETVSHDYS
jgi:hypothetical protein